MFDFPHSTTFDRTEGLRRAHGNRLGRLVSPKSETNPSPSAILDHSHQFIL